MFAIRASAAQTGYTRADQKLGISLQNFSFEQGQGSEE